MPNEYPDAIHSAWIDTAVALTLDLHEHMQSVPIGQLANRVVDGLFCTCVTSAADAVARGRAPVHKGLIAEVRRQALRSLARGEAAPDLSDPVDRASAASFPASDPPAWIWG